MLIFILVLPLSKLYQSVTIMPDEESTDNKGMKLTLSNETLKLREFPFKLPTDDEEPEKISARENPDSLSNIELPEGRFISLFSTFLFRTLSFSSSEP